MLGELLRNKNAQLLFAGQSLSMFGDMSMLVVLGIWTKSLTGSSGLAGSVYATLTGPSLFVFLLGPTVDRFSRRRVMIVTDLAMAIIVLGLLAVHGRGQTWIIFLVALAYGTSLGVFSGARAGLLQEALHDAQLGTANGVLTTANQACRMIAPLAGAALFVGSGGRMVAILDSLTFCISAAATYRIRVHPVRTETREGHYLRCAASGMRHLVATRFLRSATTVTIVCMLSVGLAEALIFAVVANGLHKPPSFVAVLGAAQGVGALIAGIGLTAVIGRVGEIRPIAVGLVALGLGAALLGVPSIPLALAGSVFFGAGIPVVMICLTTLIQRRTDPSAQGRVFTAFELCAGGPQLVSILVGAVAVTVLPFRVPLGLMVIGLLLAACYSARTLKPAQECLDSRSIQAHPD